MFTPTWIWSHQNAVATFLYEFPVPHLHAFSVIMLGWFTARFHSFPPPHPETTKLPLCHIILSQTHVYTLQVSACNAIITLPSPWKHMGGIWNQHKARSIFDIDYLTACNKNIIVTMGMHGVGHEVTRLYLDLCMTCWPCDVNLDSLRQDWYSCCRCVHVVTIQCLYKLRLLQIRYPAK